MLVIKTQKEFNSYIKNGLASFDCDVDIKCSISTRKDIKVHGNIDAWDIDAWNINAGSIKVGDINAENIDAENINARNINAGDISFYAVAFACESFQCKSISGRRDNSKYF